MKKIMLSIVLGISLIVGAIGTKEIKASATTSDRVNWDFNANEVIDIEDVAKVASRYNDVPGSDTWDCQYDLNIDYTVDIYDIVNISKCIGRSAPILKPAPVIIGGKTYTGNQVKEKLYRLGFVTYNKGLLYNRYGHDGTRDYDYMSFSNFLHDTDIYLVINNSNLEVDKKIRAICDYILPTQGGTLYAILDTYGLRSQTLQLDGRSISIEITSFGICIDFGPIIR